jgi:hypothetical protein
LLNRFFYAPKYGKGGPSVFWSFSRFFKMIFALLSAKKEPVFYKQIAYSDYFAALRRTKKQSEIIEKYLPQKGFLLPFSFYVKK